MLVLFIGLCHRESTNLIVASYLVVLTYIVLVWSLFVWVRFSLFKAYDGGLLDFYGLPFTVSCVVQRNFSRDGDEEIVLGFKSQ